MYSRSGTGWAVRGQQVTRQLLVLQMLESARRGLTPNDICGRLEDQWAVRTIYRDLEQLRGAGFPITEDSGRYILDRPEGWSIPVDPSMVLALAVSEELLEPLHSTAFSQPLQDLRKRLSAMLTPEGHLFLGELRGTVRATTLRTPSYEAKNEIIETVQDAISRQHVLWIRYAKPGDPVSEREVEPWLAWVHTAGLYLVGFDRSRNAERTFAMQRIEEARMLDEAFEPDPNFDPEDFVRRGFGVYHGAIHRVVLDFDPDVAHIPHEKNLHQTQRIREKAEGRVQVTMDAAGLPELAAWVASFGGRVHPRHPSDLVELVRGLHEAGLKALNRINERDGL